MQRATISVIITLLAICAPTFAALSGETSREALCNALPKRTVCAPVQKNMCGEAPVGSVKIDSNGISITPRTGTTKSFKNTKGSDVDSRYHYRGYCAGQKHFWLWSARSEGGLNEFVSYQTGHISPLWGIPSFSPSGKLIAIVYWVNYGGPPEGIAFYQFSDARLMEVQKVLFPKEKPFPGNTWPLWTNDAEIVLFEVTQEGDEKLKAKSIIGRIKYDGKEWQLQN